MFKKDEIIISQQNIMSNKERKEFISVYLKKLFDSSLIETHLFESKWQSQKIAGSKKRIIFYEENPIFFEYDKDIYFPTVYLLNRIPMIIKYDCLIYPDTDDYLKNGADLMVKGILNRKIFPTSFQLGTCFKVITLNGEITSIGVSLVSSSLLSTLNEKGKFLTIVHRKDDFLFKLGTEKYSSTWTDGKLNAFSIAQTCGLIKPVEQLESIKQVEKSNLEYLFDQNASELENKTKESIFTEKIASNDSKFITNEISSKFDINFIFKLIYKIIKSKK